jgi:hypothetical protein
MSALPRPTGEAEKISASAPSATPLTPLAARALPPNVQAVEVKYEAQDQATFHFLTRHSFIVSADPSLVAKAAKVGKTLTQSLSKLLPITRSLQISVFSFETHRTWHRDAVKTAHAKRILQNIATHLSKNKLKHVFNRCCTRALYRSGHKD